MLPPARALQTQAIKLLLYLSQMLPFLGVCRPTLLSSFLPRAASCFCEDESVGLPHAPRGWPACAPPRRPVPPSPPSPRCACPEGPLHLGSSLSPGAPSPSRRPSDRWADSAGQGPSPPTPTGDTSEGAPAPAPCSIRRARPSIQPTLLLTSQQRHGCSGVLGRPCPGSVVTKCRRVRGLNGRNDSPLVPEAEVQSPGVPS